ncbi:SCP2 sterol-binding domain-containing protein [Micromonospora sp. CPCC 206060]|uniref:SCP2 sterol-binding domain-containing protein n=1 Tax=Micromonospora sp. CPCC 206060 TaxID=3122406 RepID=UPI002FF413BB
MASPIAEFFTQLSQVHHERLERITGSIRFEIMSNGGIDKWLLEISSGNISARQEEGTTAHCVIHSRREVLENAIRGEQNLTAAWLSGCIAVDGRLELFRLFERLLPGPPAAQDPRDLVPGRKGEHR